MRIVGIGIVAVALVLSLGGATVDARQARAPQEKPALAKVDAAPALTDVQKLQIQNLAQAIELAQLRAQAAQADFDKARTAIAELVKSLQKDGYDLDLQTMTYAPKKDAPPVKK